MAAVWSCFWRVYVLQGMFIFVAFAVRNGKYLAVISIF